jgi:glycosyltransferase involved in cell wall biosynthesis
MRIGIFNEHWHTLGGGEQSALQIAAALQSQHEVALICTEPIEKKVLENHCQENLSAINLIFSKPVNHSLELMTSDFDVFINHSHQSTLRNFAKFGIYQVMFPQDLRHSKFDQTELTSKRQWTYLVDRIHGLNLGLQGEDCFVARDAAWFSLSSGHKSDYLTMKMSAPTGTILRSTVFNHSDNSIVSTNDTLFENGKHEIISLSVKSGPCVIGFRAINAQLSQATKVPFKLYSVRDSDNRQYGATEISSNSNSNAEHPLHFLSSYNLLVSNSEYTQFWTEKFLGYQSTVIYPPVVLSSKQSSFESQILSVGRFFGGDNVHSKNQHVMVECVRSLPTDFLKEWKLVLVGGTSREHRMYAENVRAQAQGLPVVLLFNASRELLLEELQKSSIYWHLAGFGSDLTIHPESAEHFGIAIVEAMSAGIIPLAYNAGGPREILKNFPDLLFNTLDELKQKTILFSQHNNQIDDLRRRLRKESEKYGSAIYHNSWQQLITSAQ